MGKWQLIIIMVIVLLGGFAALNSNNPAFYDEDSMIGKVSEEIKEKAEFLSPMQDISTGLERSLSE